MPASREIVAVGGLIDHLFRSRAGQMVAWLTRIFGPEHLELAEEVVQDALVKALHQWPFHGVPDNPAGWLMRVARNGALDVLRREAVFRDKTERIRRELPAAEDSAVMLASELPDDQLRLIFMCCHPSIPRDGRVALSLKTAGGFSVAEIARAFLVDESTVAQRLVRAKRQIRDEHLPFELPPAIELAPRLDSVLEVVYLLFNEGYSAHEGEDLVRFDLCGEAVRLGRLLAAWPATDLPTVHALLALMLFQSARLPARVDAAGDMVLLDEQDRSKWDRGLVVEGFRHFDRAATGDDVSAYHIQAAIAAAHGQSMDDRSTDWPGILELYDQLLLLDPSPIVVLNRAVAVARVQGPDAALAALDAIDESRLPRHYYLLSAARAEFLMALGRSGEASQLYRRALASPCSEPERRFLRRRLAGCAAPQST